MGRKAKGAVEWRRSRGQPEGWYVRLYIDDKKRARPWRPWVYLDRPDLANTDADRETAENVGANLQRVAKARGAEGLDATPPPPVGGTIAAVADRWLELVDLDPETKHATRAQYRSVMQAHVVRDLGELALTHEAITTPVLRAFFRAKVAKKAASTVRNIANTLTRFFADAKAEGWTSFVANPMRDEEVRAVLPSVESPDPDDIVQLKLAQVDRLLALGSMREPDFGVTLLELVAGVRDGEAYGLRFADIDLEEGVFRAWLVQQALVPRGKGTGGVRIGPLKSKWSRRRVPLHPVFAAWLVGWALEGWRTHVHRDPKPDDLVFPNDEGRVQRPSSAAERLRGYLEAAGLPQSFRTSSGEPVLFDTQALRHTFSTLLGGQDVVGEVVDRLLGHQPATTRGRHYQAPRLAVLERAIASLPLAWPPRLGGRER